MRRRLRNATVLSEIQRLTTGRDAALSEVEFDLRFFLACLLSPACPEGRAGCIPMTSCWPAPCTCLRMVCLARDEEIAERVRAFRPRIR